MLHWRHHVDRIRAVIAHSPVGLITDIDGTISPIAPTPDAATVDPACRDALQTLSERLFVAAVSGRAATDAKRLVGLDNLIYIGNHGMDRLTPQGLHVMPQAQRYTAAIKQLLSDIEANVTLPGMLLEDKGSTASVHYRLCEDPPKAREVLLDFIRPRVEEAGLVVTEGRLVLELRPPVRCNKGTAVRSLIDDYQLGSAMYLGDDVTDVDAFDALHAWRDTRGGHALALGVVGSETPAAVAERSDVHLHGIADVAAFLQWLDARK